VQLGLFDGKLWPPGGGSEWRASGDCTGICDTTGQPWMAEADLGLAVGAELS